MRQVYLIELVVGLYAFGTFMTYPLLQQYIYRCLWQQLSHSAYPSNQSLPQCASNRTNITIHEMVQRGASIFLLKSELCFLFPSLAVSLVLVSYSDHWGRKVTIVPPLMGEVLFSFIYFVVSFWSLSLDYLLLGSFIAGTLGGPAAIIGGSFAYLADRCDQGAAGTRTVRMAVLDMLLGVLSGMASLCTGFFTQAVGFSWPFLTAALLHLLNLLFVLVGLRESLETPSPDTAPVSAPAPAPAPAGLPHWRTLAVQFQGAYLLFGTGTRRRNLLLALMLSAFAFYKMAELGSRSIFILYELNTPLCWNEVLVGYGSALSSVIFLGSFVGVSLLSRCLPDAYIVLLGLLSVTTGVVMTAFAKTTLLMLLVRLPLLLSIMPTPVLRSMMSKMVSNSEQGAVFACVAFVELLSTGMAFIFFTSVYAATVSWFSGFSFLLAAGLTLIPTALIGVVLCLRLEVDEEASQLTSGKRTENYTDMTELSTWKSSS